MTRFFILAIGVVFAWFIYDSILILTSPMEWGVMDDASWIHQFSSPSKPASFFEFFRQFLKGELQWGLFRPTFGLYAWVVYGWLAVHLKVEPSWIYWGCFISIFLTASLYAAVVARIISESEKTNKGLYGLRIPVVFLGSFLSFYPVLNWFNLISLQEKLAVFFAGVALLSLIEANHLRSLVGSSLLRGFALFSLLLAFGAKSTAIIYALPALAIVLQKRHSSLRTRLQYGWAAGIVLEAGVWFLWAAWVAKHGAYTHQYQFSWEMIPRFFAVGKLWAYVVSAILVVGCAIAWKWKQKWPLAWIWPSGLALGLALMLPWGLYAWYWTILTPFVAGCVALIAAAFCTKGEQVATAGILLFLTFTASVGLGPKMYRLLERSVKTHEAVRWATSMLPTLAIQNVYFPLPCVEQPGLFQILVEKRTSHSKTMSFKTWDQSFLFDPATTLFATWWECVDLPQITGFRFRLVQEFKDWKFFAPEPL